MLGMVGFVAHHEMTKQRAPAGPAIDEAAEVATISTGETVDIEPHVPRQGLTIVEFTADF